MWEELFPVLVHAAGLNGTTLAQRLQEAGLKRSPQVVSAWLRGDQYPGLASTKLLAEILLQTTPEAKARFYDARCQVDLKRWQSRSA